jgi:NAD(P)H-flavin reductase
MNTSLPAAATITSIRGLTADTTLFTLNCNDKAAAIEVASFCPGQFLELSLPGIGEIPISYCGLPSPDRAIELCIRHVGHVTSPLHGAVPGDTVGLRGPFGHGFPLNSYENQDLLLIAGGLGMAPLRSLLLALLKERPRWGELTLLYGAREAGSLLFQDELQKLAQRSDIRVQLAVDSHEHCLEGPPNCRVALLPDLLDQLVIQPERTCAALCGPPVVYPYLVTGLKQIGLSDNRIHLSLERRMKCGLGRCGHCAVGTFLCCTDGPVFSHAQLRGIEKALA